MSAAELLGKMTSDKLVGPKVRLIINKLIPSAILDQMRDSPSAAVHLYNAQQENPELIWTDESRSKVSSVVNRLVEE